MTSLKQQMREMFERRNAMEFNERNSIFEDGLLEKIINLAFANLSPYNDKRWQMTLLRTPLMLQRLYRHLDDKRILSSSLALLISDPDVGARTGIVEGNIDLLLMSLTYAAKYYCIESFATKNFSGDTLKREFSLDKNATIAAVAAFGTYREETVSIPVHARYVYSDIVNEL